eukprot:3767969-Rhodomonas_salina.4
MGLCWLHFCAGSNPAGPFLPLVLTNKLERSTCKDMVISAGHSKTCFDSLPLLFTLSMPYTQTAFSPVRIFSGYPPMKKSPRSSTVTSPLRVHSTQRFNGHASAASADMADRRHQHQHRFPRRHPSACSLAPASAPAPRV